MVNDAVKDIAMVTTKTVGKPMHADLIPKTKRMYFPYPPNVPDSPRALLDSLAGTCRWCT